MDELNDIQDDLEDDVHAITRRLTGKQGTLLLGTVLKNTQTDTHYKYLFSSSGLMREQQAINRAHQKRFHLIQGKS